MLGGAFGPFIAGHIFDVTQSYLPAFQILIVLSIAGFVLSILLKATRLSTT
jgi:cyanate permease